MRENKASRIWDRTAEKRLGKTVVLAVLAAGLSLSLMACTAKEDSTGSSGSAEGGGQSTSSYSQTGSTQTGTESTAATGTATQPAKTEPNASNTTEPPKERPTEPKPSAEPAQKPNDEDTPEEIQLTEIDDTGPASR